MTRSLSLQNIMVFIWNSHLFFIVFFRFTLYHVHSKVARGNLELKHSVPINCSILKFDRSLKEGIRFIFPSQIIDFDCLNRCRYLSLKFFYKCPRNPVVLFQPPIPKTVLGSTSPLSGLCRLKNEYSAKNDIFWESLTKIKRKLAYKYNNKKILNFCLSLFAIKNLLLCIFTCKGKFYCDCC